MYIVTQGRDAIVLDPWPDAETMARLQGYRVLLVLTHEHVDHTSGLGRMQRALSARTLWQDHCTAWLRNPGNTTPVLLAALSVSRGAPARDFLRGLHLKTETYEPDMTFAERVSLDWGALHIEGYATPGHSRGSVAFIDEQDKIIFSGDNVCDALWMQLPGVTSIEEWLPSAQWLYDMSADYRIFWGHRVPQLEREYIAQVITWGKEIMAKSRGNSKLPKITQYPNRPDGIIYRTDRVFRK